MTDYIRDLRPAKWGSRSFCKATIPRTECPLWVKSGHGRISDETDYLNICICRAAYVRFWHKADIEGFDRHAPHSVRGFLAGVVRKRLKLKLVSEKTFNQTIISSC